MVFDSKKDFFVPMALVVLLALTVVISARGMRQGPAMPQSESPQALPPSSFLLPLSSPHEAQEMNEFLVADGGDDPGERWIPIADQQSIGEARDRAKRLNINTYDKRLYDSSSYTITHILKFDTFSIEILASNFSATRSLAEKKLASLLDVDQKTVCNLNVEITAPKSTRADLAGKKFPLSFCE